MSFALGLAQLTCPLSLALTGGRTPTRWQRQIAQQLAWLETLRPQHCAFWMEALTAIRPKLRDEPLLGRCLALLAGQVNHPADPAPEVARPPRPRLVGPERRQARDRSDASSLLSHSGNPVTAKRTSQPKAEMSSRRSMPILSQLKPQASRAILSRLTKETASAEGTKQPMRRSNQAPSKSRASTTLSVIREPALYQDWLRDLSQRAGRSLCQSVIAEPGQSEPVYSEASSLRDQWSAPINGQTASSEILARLSILPATESDSSVRETQPKSARSRARAAQSCDPSDMANGNGAQPWQTLEPVLSDEDMSVVVPSQAASRGVNVSSESKAPNPIAPPAVASLLPPLLTPQAPSAPTAPVATATIRQGAKQEETATEDDLSILAAKIKRILDEEARRHGIDV